MISTSQHNYTRESSTILKMKICCRKDEPDGVGQTVLVLQPWNYFSHGQCSTRGTEYHTEVSVTQTSRTPRTLRLSRKHLEFQCQPFLWSSLFLQHSSRSCTLLVSRLSECYPPGCAAPPRRLDRNHLDSWWNAGLPGKLVVASHGHINRSGIPWGH